MKSALMHLLLLLAATAFSTAGYAAGKGNPALSANVVKQMKTLAAMKASRTPAQRKMSSQFTLALRMKRGDPLLSTLPMLQAGVQIAADDTTLVDIKASVTPALLAEIESQGGVIINSFAEYDAIRARLPLDRIETLAASPDVRFIRPAVKAMLNKVNTSEGDKAHNAPAARNDYGVNGAGVKVGALSDSVDYLAAVQATGDLPAVVTVLEDAPGSTGEGTAMLEIVHDLAPGAQLYFATAWLGPASFAANIIALADAGCKVIVDDVLYFNESPFQDDVISQAVNTVTANGVAYFSSAGNSGNKNDGTSGVWEGDYQARTTIIQDYESVHDFAGDDAFNRITGGYGNAFTLFWTDPLGGSSNDYDLFLVDPATTAIVAASQDFQDGDDDPYESIVFNDATNHQLVVARWSGVDRFIHLNTNRGQLEHNTAGQIRGHAAAENGFAVAAVEAQGMTAPFNGSESVEQFSSDGPRRVFFTPDGSPVTPGNFSSTGGKVRSKPDLAMADGVMTATPGFNPFYGTSAAAPHAAAIGALMFSAVPGLTLPGMRDAFKNAALDIEAAGRDRDSGWGIVMAGLALAEIGAEPSGFAAFVILQYLLNKK